MVSKSEGLNAFSCTQYEFAEWVRGDLREGSGLSGGEVGHERCGVDSDGRRGIRRRRTDRLLNPVVRPLQPKGAPRGYSKTGSAPFKAITGIAERSVRVL